MKRAAIVTGAAMVGVVWIATYRIAPHLAGVAAEPSSTPTPSNLPTASPATPGTATPSPSPSHAPSGTFLGSDIPNRFGDVQVRVVINNGHISDVRPVQMPFDREQSAYISQVAGPMLRTEVLQAQSAQIDIISGATYTSESYAQSVESALQQAHMG
jgi:uncharacterized protein with FMN-binding domain